MTKKKKTLNFRPMTRTGDFNFDSGSQSDDSDEDDMSSINSRSDEDDDYYDNGDDQEEQEDIAAKISLKNALHELIKLEDQRCNDERSMSRENSEMEIQITE